MRIFQITWLVLIFLHPSLSHAARLPDGYSLRELLNIAAEAKPRGEVGSKLQCYPITKTPVIVEVIDEKGRRTLRKLSVGISRNDFIVITLADTKGQALQQDVIRFHFGTQTYHRWRLSFGEKTQVRAFLGQISGTHGGSLRRLRSLNLPLASITWTLADSPFNDDEKGKVLLSERCQNANGVLIGLSQTFIRYLDNKVVTYRTFEYEPKDPEDLLAKGERPERDDFLSKLLRPNTKEDEKAEISVFEDLNFRFEHPPGFIKYEAQKLNPNASLILINGRTSTGITIFAERDATFSHITNEGLATIVEGNFKGTLTEPIFGERQKVKVGEIEFLMIRVTGKISSRQQSYITYVYSHNGFIYQIQAGYRSNKKKTEEILRETQKWLKGFSLIDPDRSAVPAPKLAQRYYAPAYGRAIKLGNLKI